jgi:hypothetical protein
LPKAVLIVLLTLGIILIVSGLKFRQNRYGYVVAAAGVALLVVTVVFRIVLGGE